MSASRSFPAIGFAAALVTLGTSGEAAAFALQTAQSAPAQPAPAPEVLDKLLAPVALYPDQLLAQMLLCAADPGRVVQLNVWLKENAKLKGTELQDAAQKAGFEPSYIALSLFPQVVTQMAEDTKWTRQLGEAFKANRDAVFGSIQRLRTQSQSVGNLKSTAQQNVETKTTEGGQQVIVIEPANPQVVYVPQYNPTVVYTQPATTTVVVQDDDDDAEAVAAGMIGFAAGIAIGAAIDNNYYYGPYGFHGGGYMYSSGWNNFYDDREDAREEFYDNRDDARDDYADHRENMAEERGDRAGNAQEQRTERQQSRSESGATSADRQAQRDTRKTEAQGKADQARASGATQQATGATQQSREARASGERQARSGSGATAPQSATATSYQSRGYSGERSGTGASQRSGTAAAERSGTRSDAFSNYSSGRSTRSESSRGQRSRSSGGRSGGGGRRR